MLLDKLSIREVQNQVSTGKIHLSDVVSAFLTAIDSRKGLNAFLHVFAHESLQRADQIEARLKAGTAGPLAGAIIAVKDNIALKQQKLTCGSNILSEFISPYDATIIQKLHAADAIIIGKTNMDEFAMGSSSEHSAFSKVRNPHNTKCVPGGSSGGSAAAIAAHLCNGAIGSDTGGSIRQPAAFCGVYGLKPTYGRVSRFGLVAFASSLDQIGPFANSVEDLALLLQTLCGVDERDSTTAQVAVPDADAALAEIDLTGKVIGMPDEFFPDDLASDIAESIATTRNAFEQRGARVIEVSLPLTNYSMPTYYIICTAEAASNLSRYDGAHFGYRAKDVRDLEEMYTKARSEGFGDEVKRRIMLGTFVQSAGYYDAYYKRAMRARTLLRKEYEKVLQQCDFLLTPTTPTTAFQIGQKQDPLSMYLSDIFTVSANLTGLPALSVPAGRDRNGLPIGVQLIGRAFDEASLLQAAKLLEDIQKNVSST